MSGQRTTPELEYHVVVNGEEQYSIWPAPNQPPAGWRIVSERPASKGDCLAEIERVWVDMLPLRLRDSESHHGPSGVHASDRLRSG
jgi:MbtH protein